MNEVSRLLAALEDCKNKHPRLAGLVGAAIDNLQNDRITQSLVTRAEDDFVDYFLNHWDDAFIRSNLDQTKMTESQVKESVSYYRYIAARIAFNHQEYFSQTKERGLA